METKPELEGSKPEDRHVDPVLEMLVAWANRGPFSIGLTLNVGGVVLTGQLIGVREYFHLFADQWSQGFEEASDEPESIQRIVNFWKDQGDSAYEQVKKSVPLSEGGRVPTYIHLKKARYFDSTGVYPAKESFLWRGRIAEVSGFALGEVMAG